MKIRIGRSSDITKIASIVRELWLLQADNEPIFLNREYITDKVDPIKYFQSIVDSKESIFIHSRGKRRDNWISQN